jgi:hypothetical protein
MDLLLLLQWMLFGLAALTWMTICGTNLLLLFSHRDGPLLPLIGAVAGAVTALLLPQTMVLSSRLLLVGVLVCADPYWLAPLLRPRSWLSRR